MSNAAFESLVDDYEAARPRYPTALYDRLAATGRVLELGAGTGIATRELARTADVVATDLGPRMLGRLHEIVPAVPAVVARAEALPFADASFDLVCGAQMWHWVDVPLAAAEVARVLRPGGPFVVTFSDRCFPTKAIRGWLETDDEGHVRIVGAYFAVSGGFGEVSGQLRTRPGPGDPLYGVWAARR